MNKYRKTYLLAAVSLGLTLSFFAPLNNYFHNIYEYSFLLQPVVASVSQISLAVTAAIILLPLIPAGILRLKKPGLVQPFLITAAALYAYAAFLFWLQGTIIAPDLGVLDGRPIDWDFYRIPVLINTLIWLACIGIFIFKFTFFKKQSLTIALIILAMQSVNTIANSLSQPEPYGFKIYDTNQAVRNQFSAQKNVIIIILDTFQSDIFESMLARDPGLKTDLAGFTFYRDVAGGYPTTMASIPLIMTGQFYKNDEPFQEFIERTYTNSLPSYLKAQDYHVYLPCGPMVYCNDAIADTFVKKPTQTSLKSTEYAPLLKPTAIRYLPSMAYMTYQKNKTQINEAIDRDLTQADNSTAIYQADQALLSSIIDNAATSSAKPAFRFYHFMGAHPPFSMDETGAFNPQPNTYEGQITHSIGALTLAQKIMATLKTLNIYDQTMIIIMGDHGYGPLGYKQTPQDKEVVSNQLVGSAMPLLLIKPFNATAPLAIDDTPISYETVSGDIINYLETGKLTMTPTIVRHFYFYRWGGDWEAAYFPPFEPYTILGPVKDAELWVKQETPPEN